MVMSLSNNTDIYTNYASHGWIYCKYMSQLTPGSRQDHVREIPVGGDLCDPAIVAHQGPAQL